MKEEPSKQKCFTTIARLIGKSNDPSIDDETPCKKRALLVAVSYAGLDPDLIGPLPGTEADVKRIAKVLVETQDYQLENIRVLANGFGDHYTPTKQNILKGIAWLGKNCALGDFRVFTYSGHGLDDPQPIEYGDANRKVYNQNQALTKDPKAQIASPNGRKLMYSREAIIPQDLNWLRLCPDDSDDEPEYVSADEGEHESGTKTTNLRRQHPETSYQRSIKPKSEGKGLRIDESKLIFDTELNHAFAGLPENATLTCVFDCCHSGRMLSLPIKRDGGGPRSHRLSPQLMDRITNMHIGEEVDSPEAAEGMSENLSQPAAAIVNEDFNVVNNLGLDYGICVVNTTGKGAPSKTVVEVGANPAEKKQQPPEQNTTCGQDDCHDVDHPQPPEQNTTCGKDNRHDVDHPQPPKAEQQTNKIKARTYCWSAAHQRQFAQEVHYPSLNQSYGLFTSAFCNVLESKQLVAPNPQVPVKNQVTSSNQKRTYRQTFAAVDAEITEQLIVLNAHRPPGAAPIQQFAQLWTSRELGNDLDTQLEM